jgi:DNA-binding transcriptional MerR regulator
MTSPAASHPHPTSPRGEAMLSIGEVLGQLRPEFPDITISKLRFLEAEGLVEPMRAPSGYRKYTAAHVERLRFVLAAQRDRYLPLRVIREQIQAMDRGERVFGVPVQLSAGSSTTSGRALAPSLPTATRDAPAAAPSGLTSERGTSESRREDGATAAAGARASAASAMNSAGARASAASAMNSAGARASAASAIGAESKLTRAQLSERSGLDEAGLVDLEQYGLLVPGPGGYYSGEALTVARVAAQLAEYGLEGRHLRPYRATADREVGLLAQLVTTMAKQGSPGAREQAFETVHELAALCAQLHGALVRQGLRQVLGG